MSTEFLLRRNGRVDVLDTHIAQVALARELERAQVVIVGLQLDIDELRDELERRETLRSWVPIFAVLLLGILIALVVFAFQPVGVVPR